MTRLPWSSPPLDLSHFSRPPREFGILPFWFLNGNLSTAEMQCQLHEFRDKGMPGIILHGRYGLETPYLGETYLDRIRLAVDEGTTLGLESWIYDEMNWPSGTADGRVLRERPDLAQRYLECVSFPVRGPWFSYLTGADSRYLDFERSTPVAAFAVGENGQVLDLTPNLSFGDVIPWEAPPGNWYLMYLVEKRADYYIDALDPEATATFLRLGYDPYLEALGPDKRVTGFYTDEPAMHYFLTGGDNPIVPWTKDMFLRFLERNGYNLRPRLPDLFFDISPDSARVRYDFYGTLTDFYSDAYYRQIHDWCRERDVVFTGHLLYEESLRKLIRVEGNLFKHYTHFDVVGVDHLYPFIGNRDRPDEHVAMKVASSAAHYLGSERLLCESFGGIFMDATMQRMKWIADWEYVLGVNLLNPHGFHYTLEGPRKRDWPPSMFYQYPWWHYYGAFSEYISRLSSLLTGGTHVAKIGVIWPINSMFATYTPQSHHPLGDRTEHDFNALTDLLLRLHYDYDYVDEDILADAAIVDGTVRLGAEAYELLILPPMTHLQLRTVERLEEFVGSGGRLLGMVFLPGHAFGPDGLVDISERMTRLFGVEPHESQTMYQRWTGLETGMQEHDQGKVAFLKTYALARQLPARLQEQTGTLGKPESQQFVIEPDGDTSRYYYAPADAERQEITDEVVAERRAVADVMAGLIAGLIAPDVTIDNPEIFYLHRVKDGRDLYFLVNPTSQEQRAKVTVSGTAQPLLWNPSTGEERPIVPWHHDHDRTSFAVTLGPVGSAVVVPATELSPRVVETNVTVEQIDHTALRGYSDSPEASAVIADADRHHRLTGAVRSFPEPLTLDGDWEFVAEDANALVIGRWMATPEVPGASPETYMAPQVDTSGWLPMVPGAWSYQLPSEPDRPYPIDVWYRVEFAVNEVPSRLDLIVDGFAGSGWSLYVNGLPATSKPVRSPIDSQMQSIDVTSSIQQGSNVIALRLTLTSATDGLLDLIKLMGPFSLDRQDGQDRIAAPRSTLRPVSWTGQGYPYYSGRGLYRRRITLPDAFTGFRTFVEPAMIDDVLELVVNGRTAGVRLWPPYELEITELLQPGENIIELRVANTLVNLLEATERPSGLAGPPRVVARADVLLSLPVAAEVGSSSPGGE